VKHSYQKYLSSPHWRNLQKSLKSNPKYQTCYSCDLTLAVLISCGDTDGIDLHHISYKNIGNETEKDIVPLCSDCHHRVHKYIKSERISSATKERYTLANAHKLLKDTFKNYK